MKDGYIMKDSYTFADLCEIIDALLGENGCPWDKAQTHESLLPHLLEEAYEVIDATQKADMGALCEELGDVLLQVALHSKIAEKERAFTMGDVTTVISRKMIRRHPHIFGDAVVSGAEQVLDAWERIKTDEKGFASHTEALRSVPAALPALMRAEKIVSRAGKAGIPAFSEDGEASARADLEALARKAEGLSARMESDVVEMGLEIGEMLFTIVTISRKLRINTEFALTNAVEQFINRFEHMENSYKQVFNIKEESFNEQE